MVVWLRFGRRSVGSDVKTGSGLAARVAPRFIAVLFGSLAGFFVAFNAVFSDVFGVAGRVGVMFYVLTAYGVLGLLAGVLGPATGWRWAWWLFAPGAVILVAYTFDEPQAVLWHLMVAGLAWTGSAGGALSGAGLRTAIADRRKVASGTSTDE